MASDTDDGVFSVIYSCNSDLVFSGFCSVKLKCDVHMPERLEIIWGTDARFAWCFPQNTDQTSSVALGDDYHWGRDAFQIQLGKNR